MIKQIRAAEEEAEVTDSPVSTAIDLEALRGSENPVEKSIAGIIPMLEDIRSMVWDMEEVFKSPELKQIFARSKEICKNFDELEEDIREYERMHEEDTSTRYKI